MASPLNQPGYLTKLVKRIRASAFEKEQAQDSEDAEASSAEKSGISADQARIKLKRHDDMVRKREFNYLRKMRGKGLKDVKQGSNRPSMFQTSSSFVSNEQGSRVSTVGKIDAIESQLTKQWGQTEKVLSPAEAKSTGSGNKTSPAESTASAPQNEVEMDLDFTGLLGAAQPPVVELGALDYLPTDIQDNEQDVLPSRYHSASLESVEMGVRNEALQDAAARFAEGDSEGAEAALIAALQSPDSDNETAEACSSALLDLYRATGQQDSFEVVAIEYAQLFGRSAPEWRDLTELADSGGMSDGSEQAAQPSLEAQSHWVCPPELEIWDLATLQSLAGQAVCLHLSWNELRAISAEAAQPLLNLFRQWAQRTMELHVSGEETLLGVLTTLTPLGVSDTDEVWWNLRLELLRLLGRHETFEEVALDYCVTYEISPPSWAPTRCTLVGEDSSEIPTQPADLEPSGPSSRLLQEAATLALAGVLVGDVTPTLEQLSQRVAAGVSMVISCARLVRVDFTAAASILNWITAYQSQGGVVQFVDVPGLLAAYFEIMGISSQAIVTLKRA